MIVFIIGIFGWIWAISTQLHKKLPMEANLNIKGFKIIFSVPIVYMLALTVWMATGSAAAGSGENQFGRKKVSRYFPLHG